MRKTLLMSAALFGVAVAAPAFAQTTSPMQSTQTPPSSQSGQQAPQPANSMPAGAAGQGGTRLNQTGGSQTYQGNVSTGAPTNTGATPSQYGTPAGQSTTSGSTGTSESGTASTQHEGTAHHRRHDHTGTTAMGTRPGHEPGVGESEPSSTRASNINRRDTHSDVAPRLPTPRGGENASPDTYLRDAQRALGQHRTGAAQEALERAETAFLNNPSNPAEPGGAVSNPQQQATEQARQALGRGDTAGALQLVNQALSQTASGGSPGGGSMGGPQGGGSMGGPQGGGAPRGSNM